MNDGPKTRHGVTMDGKHCLCDYCREKSGVDEAARKIATKHRASAAIGDPLQTSLVPIDGEEGQA